MTAGRRKYLYRVLVDSPPPEVTDRWVRHPDAEEVQIGVDYSEERPGPLTIPEQLPGVVRHFQSLSAAMRLVDLYGRAGCKAHHERSNPISWDTP